MRANNQIRPGTFQGPRGKSSQSTKTSLKSSAVFDCQEKRFKEKGLDNLPTLKRYESKRRSRIICEQRKFYDQKELQHEHGTQLFPMKRLVFKNF